MWVVMVMDVGCYDSDKVDLIGALHTSLERLGGQGLLQRSGSLGGNIINRSGSSEANFRALSLSHLVLLALK